MMEKKKAPSNIEKIYGLSPMQEGMLFHHLLGNRDGVYIEQYRFRITGQFDAECFERSVNHVISRHDILRTAFIHQKIRVPRQVVFKKRPIKIEVEDLRSATAQEQSDKIESLATQKREKGFDLTNEPLLEFSIFQTEAETYEVIWGFHHILMDGWCVSIVLDEIIKSYKAFLQGQQPELPRAVQFRGFIDWLETQDQEQAIEFWREYLSGYETATSFPRFEQKSTEEVYEHAIAIGTIPVEISDRLTTMASQSGTTLSVVLNTLWGILLQKYNDTNDAVFGTTVTGRSPEIDGVEKIVGLMINSIPVRITTDPGANFLQVLDQANRGIAHAKEFEFMSLTEVQSLSPLRNELFSHIVLNRAYKQQSGAADFLGKDAGFSIDEFKSFYQTNYDLSVYFFPDEEIKVELTYNGNAMESWVVSGIIRHFTELARQVALDPEIKIENLDLLSAEEKAEQVTVFNPTPSDYPKQSIAALFEEQVRLHPENTAISHQNSHLTYAELNQRANALASLMMADPKGIGFGLQSRQAVSILLPGGIDMVVSILATLKAGGVYVPIDPKYPQERINLISGDTDSSLVICFAEDRAKAEGTNLPVLVLGEVADSLADDAGNPEIATDPEDLAYILFTSGSTGRPKGVLVPQRAVVRLVKNTNYCSIEPEETILAMSSFTFDAATFDMWMPLLNGGRMLILPWHEFGNLNHFLRALEGAKVAGTFLTAALFHALIDSLPEFFESFNRIVVGGEPVSPIHARKFLKRYGTGVLYNGYGPTENTTFSTYYPIDQIPDTAHNLPIGKPLANSGAYILSKQKALLPKGAFGEICVWGDGLSHGYLNQGELTAEKFIEDPLHPGRKIYRTGDLGRLRENGDIEILGRIDQQVKIRGHRMEPGEIETAFIALAGVKEAKVSVLKSPAGDKFLSAWVVCEALTNMVDVRNALRDRLPHYMVPEYIQRIEKMPLNVNGKIDSAQLPNPLGAGQVESRPAKIGPTNPIEANLLGIWKELLAIQEIGIRDNFFQLGGHSLTATRLVSRINKELNVEVKISQIFQFPTVKELAEAIAGAREEEFIHIKPLPKRDSYPISPSQRRLWMLDQIGEGSLAYLMPAALRLEGNLNDQALELAMLSLLKRHESLRTCFAMSKGEVRQIITKAENFALQRIDLSGEDEAEREAEKLAEAEYKISFDLSVAPLIRAKLIRLAEDEHVLLVTMHHIISDGWSMNVFLGELASLYRQFSEKLDAGLTPLPIQYRDFASWINQKNDSRTKNFWMEAFAGNLPVLQLPTDFPRPKNKTFGGDMIEFWLDRNASQRLSRIGKNLNATSFVSLLSLVYILLKKYSGQDDIIVGTPSAGRVHADLENQIGYYLNTLPLRHTFKDSESFEDLLVHNRDMVAQAFENQHYPFEKLVNDLKLAKDFSRSPLFDVLVVLQNNERSELSLPGIRIEPFGGRYKISKFDLSFIFLEEGGQFRLGIEYNTDLFLPETISQIGESLVTLAGRVLEDPSASISSWLSEETPLEELEGESGKWKNLAYEQPELAISALSGQAGGGAYTPPKTKIQRDLAEVWREVLRIPKVGMHDNFFESGGNSLNALNVVSGIQRKLNIELTLSEIFEHPTISGMEKLVQDRSRNIMGTLDKAPEQESYGLSGAQRRLWVLDQIHEAQGAYNMPMSFRLRGKLQTEALKGAFEELLRRHESFRTTFNLEEGIPVSRIHSEARTDFAEIDLRSEKDSEAAARRLALQELSHPFSLERLPLVRMSVLQIKDQESILLINMHHIISDGWSMNIFFSELTELYNALVQGQPAPLEPLAFQYRDYVHWQNNPDGLERIGQLREYWHEKLADPLPVLELPSDHPRPAIQTYSGAVVQEQFGAEITTKIKDLGWEQDASMFMTLVALVNLFLYRITHQKDILVGTSNAGRIHPDLGNIIGYFLNTLVLRNEIDPEMDFLDLLKSVKSTVLEAFEHQEYPFESLVDELVKQRDLSRPPIFNVLVMHQNIEFADYSFRNLSLSPFLEEWEKSRYDLTVTFGESEAGLGFSFEYNTDLFSRDTMLSLAATFRKMTLAILEDPLVPLYKVDLRSKEGGENSSAPKEDWKPASEFRSLAEVFAENAARFPSRSAIHWQDKVLNYSEVEEQSGQLAAYLREQYQVGPGDAVAICLSSGFDLILSILAAFKCGAGVALIDPALPRARKNIILQDQLFKVLVFENPEYNVAEIGLQLSDHRERINGMNAEIPVNGSDSNRIGNEDIAFFQYTSGSSGHPKAVAITQRNLFHIFSWYVEYFGFKPEDVLPQKTTISFVDSLVELLLPITLGAGTVYLKPSDKLNTDLAGQVKWFADIGATLLQFVPSVFEELTRVADIKQVKSLRTLLLSGEKVTRFYDLGLPVFNLYGCSEGSLFATCKAMDPEDLSSIGQPVGPAQIYILNEHLEPCPEGVSGEIFIGGEVVAAGYLNRPELTSEKFIEDPLVEGGRMFRTGDLARRTSKGEIRYQSRADKQFKIRGVRIEPGEIEHCMEQIPAVTRAIATTVMGQEAEKVLVVYYTSEEEVPRETIHAHFNRYLPVYMQPSWFMYLQEIPLNANGKVDFSQLPAPGTVSSGLHVAPESESEKTLASIWSEVLKVESPGLDDNFFQIGGHSLKAMRVLSRVYKEFEVELQLTDIFRATTIRQLALLIDSKKDVEADFGDIQAITEAEHYEISHAQRRLWVLSQMDSAKAVYNLPVALRLEGELHIPALEEALAALIDRHESFRTGFRFVDGGPVQYVVPEIDFQLPFEDLTDSADPESEARHIAKKDAHHDFDLANPPLLKARLLMVGSKNYLLVLNLHHLIIDGWSSGIFSNELTKLYAGLRAGSTPELPRLKIQYKDFAAWQNELLRSEKAQDLQRFWKGQFSDEVPVLQLPTDFPRAAVKTFAGDVLSTRFPKQELEQLKALARQHNTSLFITLQALFKVLLFRYSGQNDIVIGTSIAGRNHVGLENLVGLLVNLLPLRSRMEPGMNFAQVLAEVQGSTLQAFDHQEYPFDKLVDDLQLNRDMSRSPIFDVALVMLNNDRSEFSLGDLQLSTFDTGFRLSKFDLTFSFFEVGEEMVLHLEYNTDLFRSDTIERMQEHFRELISGVLADATTPINKLNLLNESERNALETAIQPQGNAYQRDSSIPALFKQMASQFSGNTALVFGEKRIDYAELDRETDALAHYLKTEMGLQAGDYAGILLDRTEWPVIAMLGILKAGGAYVPIDPEWPQDRKSYIFSDTGMQVLLTSSEYIFDLEDFGGNVFAMDLQMEGLDTPAEPVASFASGTDPAYLIYTSGSTGRPKGVIAPHRAVVRLVNETNYIALDENDCLLSFSSFAFDGSTFDIYGALLNGGTCVIAPKETFLNFSQLSDLIGTEAITAFFLTTALFNAIVDYHPEAFAPVRKVLFGGEKVSVSHVKRFTEAYGGEKLVHVYGPTENTTFSSFHPVDIVSGEETTIPIGKAIAQSTCMILDADLQLAPIGIPGELCVAGDGLALGYLNDEALTSEKFVPHPWLEGERIYRTGDIARRLPGGEIEFIGRIDQQVKIRGYRIEPDEVKSQIDQHTQVRESIVVVREDGQGSRHLIGYLSAQESLSSGELKGYLRQNLPDYMVPSHLVFLDSLPLNANGKVDQSALPEPDFEQDQEIFTAPETALEKSIAAIWQANLGLESVSATANYFSQGGDSIKAVGLVNEINRQTGLSLEIRDIFAYPEVRSLAGRVDELSGQEVDDSLALAARDEVEAIWKGLDEGDSRVPVMAVDAFPMSDIQKGMVFHNLMNPETGIFHTQIIFEFTDAEFDLETFEKAWSQQIERHAILRTAFRLEGFEEAMQFVCAPEAVAPTISVSDMRNMDEASQQSARQELMREDLQKPFDLEKPGLWRIYLLRKHANGIQVLWSFHHAILDGWSDASCMTEWVSLYHALKENPDFRYPPLQASYKDFVIDQVRAARLPEYKSFWTEYLADYTRTELPLNRVARELEAGHEKVTVGRALPPALKEAFDNRIRQSHSNHRIYCLAAFIHWLKSTTNSSETTVGVVGHGRPAIPDGDKMLGCFLNSLPLRFQHEGKYSGKELVDMVEAEFNRIKTYDRLSLFKVRELVDENADGKNPFFDVLFNYVNFHVLEGASSSQLHQSHQGGHAVTNTPLDFIVKGGEELIFTISAFAHMYSQEELEKLADFFEQTLRCMILDPEMDLGPDSLLTSADTQLLLDQGAGKKVPDSEIKDVVELFETSAALHAESVALHYQEESCSYRGLNEWANRIAHSLLAKGIGKGDIVGIVLDRNPALVASLLGVFKTGATALVVDTKYPENRMTFLLETTAVTARICSPPYAHLYPEAAILLDPANDDLTNHSERNPGIVPDSNSLAYLVFTSGSTGKPKPVMTTHGNLANYFHWYTEDLAAEDYQLVYATTSVGFDPFTMDLMHPLTLGKQVRILDSVLSLAEERPDEGKALIVTVPTAASELLGGERNVNNISHVILGGEPIPPALIDSIKGRNISLRNYYGPTEDTVYSFCYHFGEDTTGKRIGKPITNTRGYILDAHRRLLPSGVVGELYLSGNCVSPGYYGKDELTRQRFLPDPFAPSQRMYATGDLAKWSTDGEMEILGRIDHQVKIRGVRIESEELTASLSAYPGVLDAYALAADGFSGKFLTGFFVAETKLKHSEIIAFLKENLPSQLVPSVLMQIESFPRLANDKIDRKQLTNLALSGSDVENEYEAPEGLVAEKLAAIWQVILKRETVGQNDNFFSLGGDSILTIPLVAQIKKEFSIPMAINEIFRNPDLQMMADLIGGKMDSGEHTSEGNPEFEAQNEALIALRKGAIQNSEERNWLPDGFEEILPMSDTQQGMFFVDSMSPGSQFYHIQYSFQLNTSDFDGKRAEKAWSLMLEKHGSLRTAFFQNEFSEPVQVICAPASVPVHIPYTDLSSLKPAESKQQIRVHLEQERKTPFLPSKPGLWRISVFRKSPEAVTVCFSFHHAILDGWSKNICMEEWLVIYQELATNPTFKPEKLKADLRDFVLDQAVVLADTSHEEFWQNELENLPSLALPFGKKVPLKDEISGKVTAVFPFSAALAQSINQLAGSCGTTSKTVYLAAFYHLLSATIGSEDVVFGLASHGRPEVEDGDKLLGSFVSSVPFRVNRTARWSGKQLVSRIQEKDNLLKAHERLSLYRIKKLLAGEEEWRDSLFNILFNFVDLPDVNAAESLSDNPTFLYGQAGTENLIDFTVELGANPHILISTQQDLYSEVELERLSTYFVRILDDLHAASDQPVSSESILSDEEKAAILEAGRGAVLPSESLVDYCQRFTEVASNQADSLALFYGEERYTFRELDEWSNQIANRLKEKGAMPGKIVGLLLNRSAEMLASILGILKSGAAYVPIDPKWPQSRVSLVLEDGGIELLVSIPEMTTSIGFEGTVIDPRVSKLAESSNTAPKVSSAPADPAYLIYTSGSTGTPNGVMVNRGNLAAFMAWASTEFGNDHFEVAYSMTSYCFDVSVFELLYPLLAGRPVRILGSGLDLLDLKNGDRNIMLGAVPSLLRELVLPEYQLEHVSLLNMAGEPIPREILNAVQGHSIKVRNLYGPSEDTIFSSCYRFGDDKTGRNIGRPVANTNAYILNANLELVPNGVVGELFLSGDMVATGYVNRPELTDQRFIDHRLEPGKRLYRTGDLVRRMPDGNMEYQTRSDKQLKIRGYRVEVGEIEYALSAHPDIIDVVAVPVRKEGNPVFLTCFYTGTEIGSTDISSFLLEQLPAYMVPSQYLHLPEIPLLTSGKTDRRSLEIMALTCQRGGAGEGAENMTNEEAEIAGFWKENLQLQSIGKTDHYFQLGGDSILAVRLVAQLRSAGFKVNLSDVFNHPRFEDFSQNLNHEKSGHSEVIPVLAEQASYELSRAQYRMWMVDQMQEDNSAYNMPAAIRINGKFDKASLERAFQEVVGRHESLRTVFVSENGLPRQKIQSAETLNFGIEFIDFAEGELTEERIQKLLKEEFTFNFDLEVGPLLKVRMLKAGNQSHVMLLNMHHIVGDYISRQIFSRELTQLYLAFSNGKPAGLPPLSLQYKDFAAWETARMTGETMQKQRRFWRDYLLRVPERLALLPGEVQKSNGSTSGGRQHIELGSDLLSGMRSYAKEKNASLFMLSFAALNVLFHRYSGQKDLVLGTIHSGRSHAQLENQLGNFLNTLPVRTAIDPETSFESLLGKVRSNLLDVYDNQDWPFDLLIDDLQLTAPENKHPLFDIAVDMLNYTGQAPESDSKELEIESIDIEHRESKFDLTIYLRESKDQMVVEFEYKSEAFGKGFIEKMGRRYEYLLRKIIESPTTTISALKMEASIALPGIKRISRK